MSSSTRSSVLGLLAIECSEPGQPPRWVADRSHSERIAAAIAGDLLKLEPSLPQLGLATVGALFDQAQILRPGWPVHAALLDLQSRLGSTNTGGGLLAIGAHEGQLPEPALQPEVALFGSPLLILPWVLHGDADLAGDIASRFERNLLDRGMGGSDLALILQEAFGVQVRHVQHLTLFDLCAVTCAQYEHAGFGPIWQLIENALLTPTREHVVEVEGEPWTCAGSSVRVAAIRPAMAHYRAILAAHGISLSAAN